MEEFISIRSIGLMEYYFGLPIIDKSYGETKYICPKCKSHNITIKKEEYRCICDNCNYTNFSKPIILDKLIKLSKNNSLYGFKTLDTIYDGSIEFTRYNWYLSQVKDIFHIDLHSVFSLNTLTNEIYNKLIYKL